MKILVKKGEVNPFPLGMQKCTSYEGLSLNFTEVKKKVSNFSGLQTTAHSIIMTAGINQLWVMLSDNPLDIYLSPFGFNSIIYVHTLQYLVYIDRWQILIHKIIIIVVSTLNCVSHCHVQAEAKHSYLRKALRSDWVARQCEHMMGTRQTRVQSASKKVTGLPSSGQLTTVRTSVAQIILNHLYN